ncbi:MAG TPA: hypothetical protein VF183_07355 [Acidimicrobiales bacterium]
MKGPYQRRIELLSAIAIVLGTAGGFILIAAVVLKTAAAVVRAEDAERRLDRVCQQLDVLDRRDTAAAHARFFANLDEECAATRRNHGR